VDDEVVRWNPFLVSFVNLAEELEKLGLIYYNCGVSYVEPEGVSRV